MFVWINYCNQVTYSNRVRRQGNSGQSTNGLRWQIILTAWYFINVFNKTQNRHVFLHCHPSFHLLPHSTFEFLSIAFSYSVLVYTPFTSVWKKCEIILNFCLHFCRAYNFRDPKTLFKTQILHYMYIVFAISSMWCGFYSIDLIVFEIQTKMDWALRTS